MHAVLSPPTPGAAEGATASALLTPLDGRPAVLLTLWPDASAVTATAAAGGRAYEVEALLGHPSAGTDAVGVAAAASLVEFDGPRDARQVAADRRSSEERVWPAVSQVDGTLGALHLRAADGALAVVALVDAPATLEAALRTILSTPLLPGEDPQLLSGPDRTTDCALEDDGVASLLAQAALSSPTPEPAR